MKTRWVDISPGYARRRFWSWVPPAALARILGWVGLGLLLSLVARL